MKISNKHAKCEVLIKQYLDKSGLHRYKMVPKPAKGQNAPW